MPKSALEINLEANARRRKIAQSSLEGARGELARLLAEGKKAGVPVARMARWAHIRREDVYVYLRGVPETRISRTKGGKG